MTKLDLPRGWPAAFTARDGQQRNEIDIRCLRMSTDSSTHDAFHLATIASPNERVFAAVRDRAATSIQYSEALATDEITHQQRVKQIPGAGYKSLVPRR